MELDFVNKRVVWIQNRRKGTMKRWEKRRIMKHIIESLEEDGYCAEKQIRAYLMTNDTRYITRNGNSREWIQKLDKEYIIKYIKSDC